MKKKTEDTISLLTRIPEAPRKAEESAGFKYFHESTDSPYEFQETKEELKPEPIILIDEIYEDTPE